MSDAGALRALADRVGVLSEYIDVRGDRRETSDETREALLDAMGFAAGDEAGARAALERLRCRDREALIDPVQVVPVAQAPSRLAVRLGNAAAARPADYRLEVTGEDGSVRAVEGVLGPRADGRGAIDLPPMDLGYHEVRLALDLPGTSGATQRRIVCPAACPAPEALLGGRRAFGVWVNLYSVRSRRPDGIGNLGDLRDLAAWAASVGAAFVGLNPLHALRNRGIDVSPYFPWSRIFRNPIYLDVEAVPEMGGGEREEADAVLSEGRGELARAGAAPRIDYERVWAAKRRVLGALHRRFVGRHGRGETARGRAYEAYCRRGGVALRDFATHLALADRLVAAGHDPGWTSWPEAWRAPDGAAVREFREEHREAVDFHRYLQFETDRQLSEASSVGGDGGDGGDGRLPLGLCADLAIGTPPDGIDPWMFPGLFAARATAGAPPDAFAPGGQDWGLLPLHPLRLRDDGYRYWTMMLRSALAHAGGLRVDHVMGLLRQYWIPAGRSAAEGAYVRYPFADLAGVLALEAVRHGAVAVGESLGTLPEGFLDALDRFGVLPTQVWYFEREPDGAYRPSSAYRSRAVVAADTHDLPTLAAYWRGDDLALRRRLGLVADHGEAHAAEARRATDRSAMTRALVGDGVVASADGLASSDQFAVAVHRFLARTPASLVSVSLDDLAGEVEPVNVPGASPALAASWTRRMTATVDEIAGHPRTAAVVEAMAGRRLAAGP